MELWDEIMLTTTTFTDVYGHGELDSPAAKADTGSAGGVEIYALYTVT